MFVNAVNKNDGSRREVPEHWLANPNIFGGAFVLPADVEAAAPAVTPSPKKTSRRELTGSVETPAADVEATDTIPAQAGPNDSEE